MIKVLFVCLGNICRSPTAHGVFQDKVKHAGLESSIAVDSCGTGAWHVGSPPDSRATAAAARRGVDLSVLRARQLDDTDYQQFDYILAMDNDNLANIRQRAPAGCTTRIARFLDFAPDREEREVPDPYYGGADGFEQVLDMVESASEGLLKDICRELSQR